MDNAVLKYLNHPKLSFCIDAFANTFIAKKVDPLIIAIYRILFSILNILVIIRYVQYFDVIWFEVQNHEIRTVLYIILFCWLVASLLLMLGIGGRWTGIVQLVLSACIMRNVYTFGIFELTHLVCSWIFIFSRTDAVFSINNILLKSNNKIFKALACQYELSSRLGIFIIGVYFGMIFLYAGLDKLIDPLWFTGRGFYVFSILPWALPDSFKGITNFKWLVVVCNYFTLLIEIGFFFFFLINKTRFWAVAGLMLLSIGLTWPYNIFFIGPYAIIFSLCLLSICDIPFVRKREYQNTEFKTITIAKKRTKFFISISLILGLGVSEMNSMFTVFKQEYHNVKAMNTSTIETFKTLADITPDIPATDNHLECGSDFDKLHITELYRPINFLNVWFIRSFQVGLFSSKHLVGLYAYRIIMKASDGNIIEPVKYYCENKNRGKISSEAFTLNIFHSAIYNVSDLCFRLSRKIKPIHTEFLYRFFAYSLSKTDISKVVSVSLIVAPMDVPFEFKGAIKQNINNWKEILHYDMETKTYTYVEFPEHMSFQARNPELPDYFPKYEWNKILHKNY